MLCPGGVRVGVVLRIACGVCEKLGFLVEIDESNREKGPWLS